MTLSHEYFAPDLLFAETTTPFGRRSDGLSSAERGQQLVEDIGRIAVETVPSRLLAKTRTPWRMRPGAPFYDSLYLAFAVRLKTRMITADDRLKAAVSREDALYLCANLRRAARLVSQLYESEAGWSGLRVTQFSVLQAIARTGTITHSALGSLLGLEPNYRVPLVRDAQATGLGPRREWRRSA